MKKRTEELQQMKKAAINHRRATAKKGEQRASNVYLLQTYLQVDERMLGGINTRTPRKIPPDWRIVTGKKLHLYIPFERLDINIGSTLRQILSELTKHTGLNQPFKDQHVSNHTQARSEVLQLHNHEEAKPAYNYGYQRRPSRHVSAQLWTNQTSRSRQMPRNQDDPQPLSHGQASRTTPTYIRNTTTS